MPQSLHSLLLAKNSATASSALGSPKISDQRQDFATSAVERNFDHDFHDLPPDEQEEEELIGTSVLMYEDTSEPTNDSPRIPGEFLAEAAHSFESGKYRSIDEASARPASHASNAKDSIERKRLELENESLMLQIQQHKHIMGNNLEETQRLRHDNETFQMQLQQQMQKKSKADKDLADSESRCNDLLLKVSELEESKANFRKAKLEHDASLQRLSSENGFLKAAQRDISSVNLSAEKKTAALEASKLAMIEQVKAIEQQLSENAISNRKTQESLLSAERQLSQLDAENILLRQLRVDLDASVRECSQLKRQIISFEAELGSLRAENTQMRQNLNGSSSGFTLATFTGSNNGNNGHNGHSGESDLYSSTFQRISTQVPLNGKERSREQYAQSDATADRDQRPIGYPPPAPQTRDSGVNYQQDQQISSSRSNRAPLSSFASPTYTHLRSSREEGEFDRPRTSLIPGDASLQSSFELDGRRSSAVQSLADIMGGRRSTVHGDPSQRSTLADILSPPIKSFPSSGSYEGDRYRSDGNVSTNDTCFLSPMTAPVNTAPVPRRQVNLDIPSRRNSSGGGMSTFYDDNGHAAGAVRAPFGTSQSAASSMVSYEETDRRLTALMTEKALLNEESSRLLQRGGKVLRERTRLQYVEARLDELGKEIAVERKKLSGKPG